MADPLTRAYPVQPHGFTNMKVFPLRPAISGYFMEYLGVCVSDSKKTNGLAQTPWSGHVFIEKNPFVTRLARKRVSIRLSGRIAAI